MAAARPPEYDHDRHQSRRLMTRPEPANVNKQGSPSSAQLSSIDYPPTFLTTLSEKNRDLKNRSLRYSRPLILLESEQQSPILFVLNFLPND